MFSRYFLAIAVKVNRLTRGAVIFVWVLSTVCFVIKKKPEISKSAMSTLLLNFYMWLYGSCWCPAEDFKLLVAFFFINNKVVNKFLSTASNYFPNWIHKAEIIATHIRDTGVSLVIQWVPVTGIKKSLPIQTVSYLQGDKDHNVHWDIQIKFINCIFYCSRGI